MKYPYGTKSKEVLATCHPDLRLIFNEAAKHMDIKPYDGIRTQKKQKQYFNEGKSQLDGVIKKSKHQGREVSPEVYNDDKNIGNYSMNEQGEPIISFALDAAPYPIDWNDRKRFYYMAGLLVAISWQLYKEGRTDHVLRWGGDWDKDGRFNDQTFHDLPHTELYKPK